MTGHQAVDRPFPTERSGSVKRRPKHNAGPGEVDLQRSIASKRREPLRFIVRNRVSPTGTLMTVRSAVPPGVLVLSLSQSDTESTGTERTSLMPRNAGESTSAGDELNDSAQGGQNRHDPDRYDGGACRVEW